VRRMIDWLGREHGLAPIDAYMLCSVGIDLRISDRWPAEFHRHGPLPAVDLRI